MSLHLFLVFSTLDSFDNNILMVIWPGRSRNVDVNVFSLSVEMPMAKPEACCDVLNMTIWQITRKDGHGRRFLTGFDSTGATHYLSRNKSRVGIQHHP